MSQREVERAIQVVQYHISAFQPYPPQGPEYWDVPANNHETSTRYIIIDPVLRALGWDLSDHRDCVVEYHPWEHTQDAVDYALLRPDGEPAVVVEAKRIDVHSKEDLALDQMDRYLGGVPTAQVAVVTNGQYWEIGLRDSTGWFRESHKPLGLHWLDTAETATRLRRCLARELYRGGPLHGG